MQTLQERLRERAIRGRIVADDLDIDRRGQTEIYDLTDDVRGQECEGHAGELGAEAGSQGLHVPIRGRV
ncbi:MAG TPA: hypothetical protein VGH12_08530, partial [Steroidobacteraceae bacterium]